MGVVFISRAMGILAFCVGMYAFVHMVIQAKFVISLQSIGISILCLAMVLAVSLITAWQNIVLFLGDKLQVKTLFKHIDIPLHQIIEVGTFGLPHQIQGFVRYRNNNHLEQRVNFFVSKQLLLENPKWLDEIHARAIKAHQEFYGQTA
jgi:hypothetical protein